MIDDLLSKSNEELRRWFRAEINKASFGAYCDEYKRRLEEYYQKIVNDFNEEWSKKHFKWFFKKRRQRKLRHKIMRRYMHPLFIVVEDCIEEMLPRAMNEAFNNFTDIKDIVLGEPNYFVKENTNE